MRKIKFDAGTIDKLTDEYYTITLFNEGKQVYAGTMDETQICETMIKHYKIKFTVNR